MSPYPEIPTEVFEAVCGNPQNLVGLLRSQERLTPETREALALWLEGKIPPKRAAHRPKMVREYGDVSHSAIWITFAVERYRRVATWLKKRGKMHGKKVWLIETIATKRNLHPEALKNAVDGHPPKIPEPTTDLVELFTIWEKTVQIN